MSSEADVEAIRCKVVQDYLRRYQTPDGRFQLGRMYLYELDHGWRAWQGWFKKGVAEGRTAQEALANLRKAIALHYDVPWDRIVFAPIKVVWKGDPDWRNEPPDGTSSSMLSISGEEFIVRWKAHRSNCATGPVLKT
jgi:hypothetical protein